MQAAQACRALGFAPYGHAVAHLNRVDGTAFCAQATAHARARTDGKLARILAYGQAKAVVELGGKHRDGAAHVISHRAIDNHPCALIDLLVRTGVDCRHLLCIGKIEHGRPGVRLLKIFSEPSER